MTWTNSKYVGIGARLNLNVSLLGVQCTMTASQLHNNNNMSVALRWYTLTYYSNTQKRRWHTAVVDIDWIHIVFKCRVVRRRMLALDEQKVRWYALEHVCFWMCHCVVWVQCITITHLPAIQLQWKWHTDLRGCRFRLNTNTAYMERYCAGFERADSTLVSVCVWSWMCHCLLTMLHDTIASTHLTAIQLQWQCHVVLHWCWCWLNIRNDIYMFLAGFGQTASTLLLLNSNVSLLLPEVHHDSITIAHLPGIQLQWQCHIHDTPFCADVDIDGIHILRIYGTVSCWFWPNRT